MAETLDHIRALLVTSPAFRVALVELLVSAGLYCSRGQTRHKRIKAAGEMMAAGDNRATINNQLRDRYKVSRRTAYRDLEQALDLRQGRLF